MARIDTLRTELTDDPISVGYAGMTDEEAADSLNAVGSRTLPIDNLSPAVIYEAIDAGAFAALSDADKTQVRDILSLGGDVILTPSSRARTVLTAVFAGAGGATTRAAIGAQVQRAVSRGVELGVGKVFEVDIQDVRLV